MTEKKDMTQYVTHNEFTQFRADVSSNFDRMFSKLERMGDNAERTSRTQWSPIVTVVGFLVSSILLGIAGYIGHVSDGHPEMVQEKMRLHIHYIQKQIDRLDAHGSRRLHEILIDQALGDIDNGHDIPK